MVVGSCGNGTDRGKRFEKGFGRERAVLLVWSAYDSGAMQQTRPSAAPLSVSQRSRFYARPLSLARVPDIARCEPVVALTPRCLCMRLVIDIHVEIVAERESETIVGDVAVARYKSGKYTL